MYELRDEKVEVRLSFNLGEREVFTPKQEHTDKILILKRIPLVIPTADAVITNLKNVEIGVKTADCVGLAVWGKEWVGVIHAGWRGLHKKIVFKCIEELLKYEDNLKAFVSPSAKACCYEVGTEFRQLFSRNLFERDNKLYFDTQEEAVVQLRECGVRIIKVMESCTICNAEYPSYRRDKTKRRMLTSIIKL